MNLSGSDWFPKFHSHNSSSSFSKICPYIFFNFAYEIHYFIQADKPNMKNHPSSVVPRSAQRIEVRLLHYFPSFCKPFPHQSPNKQHSTNENVAWARERLKKHNKFSSTKTTTRYNSFKTAEYSNETTFTVNLPILKRNFSQIETALKQTMQNNQNPSTQTHFPKSKHHNTNERNSY